MKKLTLLLKKETGQALPIALILLLLGTLIIIPILNLTITNLKATQGIAQKTFDIYAADAGIDDGLWKIRYNHLPNEMLGDWDESTYSENLTYTMYDSDNPSDNVTINDRNVEVSIKPLWVLEGLEDIPPQGRTPDPDDHLLTFSGINGDGEYEISLFYDGLLAEPPEIQRIGCWLPPGFHYVEGSCNLSQPPYYYPEPAVSSHNGGKKLIWELGGIDYDDLPSDGTRKVVTIEFTPADETPSDAFAWTRSNRTDYPLSWDTARRIFEIVSNAPSDEEVQTTIISHSVRQEFQALGTSISGDYQATGNTLMRDHDNDQSGWPPWGWDQDKRERLYKETSISLESTTEDPVNGIPNNATVEQIRLYWSGWKCVPWNPTDAQLDTLPKDKHVNQVAFKVKETFTEAEYSFTVNAAQTQAIRNTYDDDPNGWSYSCFADITNQVTDYFEGQDIDFYGIATYTLGHWDIKQAGTPGWAEWQSQGHTYKLYSWTADHQNEEDVPPYFTHYPLGSPGNGGGSHEFEDGQQDQWSHAAWSIIVIYSSPTTLGHHLYIDDEFRYIEPENQDTAGHFIVKGFLAPPDVETDPNAARMTCFVGEGDDIYNGDSFLVNDVPRSDAYNPVNDVWNSKSNVLGGEATDNGIDIDTFVVGGTEGIIKKGDTEADIKITTNLEIFNVVYIILSFRSEITTGGVIDYKIY